MQSSFSSNSPPRWIVSLISIPLEFAELRETWAVSPFTCKNNAGGAEKSSCWKESAVRFHTPLNMSIQHSWVPLQHLPRQIRHSWVMLNGLHPWEIITRQWASRLHFMFWYIGREKVLKFCFKNGKGGWQVSTITHLWTLSRFLPARRMHRGGSPRLQRSGVFGGMIAFWRR